ncbi:hypothetical protein MPER_01667 [Moniliophthora perniciosa FA553]|nr:hypothetical protein MPER_01667 [Moniliophthora perniciosa FA553]
MKDGEVISTLRGMHSILDIGGPDDDIRTFHASFDDFLRDQTRSDYFFVGDRQAQHSSLACWYLHAINHYLGVSHGDEKALPPSTCSMADLGIPVLKKLP